MTDEITCPSRSEFLIRGYTVAEYLRIKDAWHDLTPEERGRYIYPLGHNCLEGLVEFLPKDIRDRGLAETTRTTGRPMILTEEETHNA